MELQRLATNEVNVGKEVITFVIFGRHYKDYIIDYFNKVDVNELCVNLDTVYYWDLINYCIVQKSIIIEEEVRLKYIG